MGFWSNIKRKKSCLFAGGVVAGLILPPLVKSKIVHKAAVNMAAKGMNLKDSAVCAYASVKEELRDVYAEAGKKAVEGGGPAE